MARKIRTEKDRRNKIKKIIIIVVILIILVAVAGVCLWKFVFDKPTPKATTVNVLDSISEYGYSLNDKDSKYFKAEYDELSKLDEEIELVENIEDENISDIQKIEIENGDIEKVNSFSNKIEDTWEKYQKFLAYYIEHDEIEKIGDKLNVIQKQTKIQDYRRCKTSNF